MSNTIADNLSRAKIQQLLAIAGPAATDNDAQVEAAEYNWQQPHYFDSGQLKELENFTVKLAKAMSDKFAALCHNEFNVKIVSVTQHFAGEFIPSAADKKQNDYYLAFGPDQNNTCGFIGMPSRTAIIWVKQLLGDTDTEENTDRTLSHLEKSLLLDIASTLIKAFSVSHSSCNFQPASGIVTEQPALKLKDTEELCKFVFRVEKTGSENSSEAYLLIPCSRLEAVVGKTVQRDNQLPAKDIPKVILEYLREIPVPLTARLASTTLTFREIMNLQVDDIVLLDKKVFEPVELIIEGRTLFYGRPAKSADKYAVVVTAQSCSTD